MRKNNIYRCLSGVMVSLLLILGHTSCNDGETGWPADSSYAGLFRPVSFGTYSVEANKVGVTFTKIIDASKYIIEVSEDSLQFAKIIKRITIDADTLTPFATTGSTPNIEFHKQIDDLNASQRHSIRIMGVNKDSTLTSKYATYTFKTLAENLLKPVSVEGNKATLKWRSTGKINYVVLYKASDPAMKNVLGADSVITTQEKTDSTKIISNLESGVTYYAKIYYNDGTARVRGTKFFKTPGAVGSFVINLQPSDNVNTLLANAYNEGDTCVTLMLSPGATYNLGAVTVPSGITSLTFSCTSSTNVPTVNLTSVTPSKTMPSGILFEYLNLVGPGSSTSSVLVDLGTSLAIGRVGFEGCNISTYNGLVRLKSTATVALGLFYLNDCIVRNIGSTGILNVAGTSPGNQLKEAAFQQSTFIDLSTQLADVRCQVTKFSVIANTFYNNSSTNKLTQLFRFNDSNTTPTTFNVSNCIFAGGNGGTALQSFYASYTALATYSFVSSIKTSDLVVSTTAGKLFTGINAVGFSSAEVFKDPANGNFTVKLSATDFPGKGYVGDPRWW